MILLWLLNVDSNVQRMSAFTNSDHIFLIQASHKNRHTTNEKLMRLQTKGIIF